jgi:phosphate transport system permease protein
MSVRSRRLEEKIFIILSGASAIFTAFILIVILGTITISGLPSINLQYLTSAEASLQGAGSGVANAIIGTIYLSLFSVAISLPLALSLAIYLKRYAKDTYVTRFIRLLIEVFSGTPSIIVGVVGLILICLYLKPITGGWSLLSGSIALAILILPVVERSIEVAIDTVPLELEDASYALGANKWHTIRGITLPCAISGIIAGTVFGIGRAAEESAVVALTTGYSQYMPEYSIGHNSKLLFGIQIYPFQDAIGSLPMAIYNSFQYPMFESSGGGFRAAFILILIILIINMSARLILRRWKIG